MAKKKAVRKSKKKSSRPKKAAQTKKRAPRRKPVRKKKSGRVSVVTVFEVDVVRSGGARLETGEAELEMERDSDDEEFSPEYGGSE